MDSSFFLLVGAMVGLLVSGIGSVLIVLTKSWHGSMSLDVLPGVQKFHHVPTPRIGGLAVFIACWVVLIIMPASIRDLWLSILASATWVFCFGLAEDLSNPIPPSWRLVAAWVSGLLFCLLSPYPLTRLDIFFIDRYLAIPAISFFITAFMMATLCNAINIIDGFNGLAAGNSLIMAMAIALMAWTVGDQQLLWLAIVFMAVMLGFLLVNFPNGHLFLGDGGAYLAGFILGSLAIMLPMRNAELSAWVSPVILAYPILEVIFSMYRKTVRRGHHPTQPDALHLHMLVYRSFGKRIARRLGKRPLANPITGMLLWTGSLIGMVLVWLVPPVKSWLMLAIGLQIVLYILVYRRVALLRS